MCLRRLRVTWGMLSSILVVVSSVAGILSFLGLSGVVLGAIFKSWVLSVPALAIGLPSLFLLVGIFFAVQKSTTARTDLVWELAHYHLRLSKNSETMIQDVFLRIRALRDGADRVEQKYFWTGTGTSDIEILSDGHYVSGEPKRIEAFRYYDVCFGHKLKAGDVEEVRIRGEFYDTGETFEPLLSKSVTEPIETLILEVSFTDNSVPKFITRYTHSSYFPADEKYSERFTFEGHTHKWEIPHPKIGYKYLLRWG